MTANDSDVSDGDTLTGSQVVRVYGENLTSPFVTLTFGGVEYTPINQGEGYIEYLLGDNGTATIKVDENDFMSFEVGGIVIPSFLPTEMWAMQKSDADVFGMEETTINKLEVRSTNCINYPMVVNENYPYFLVVLFTESAQFTEFTYHNCSINKIYQLYSQCRMNISVIDSNEVAYITYQGFIVAVFNYTTE